jgi:hypothetical protein
MRQGPEASYEDKIRPKLGRFVSENVFNLLLSS